MSHSNPTIFQFFHWYYSPEGNLWLHVSEEAEKMASLGVSHVWLPPAYKSAFGAHEPGYAVYDLYDLGEFDQKGSSRTRYGTKDEYLGAIQQLHANNIQVLADIVLNHKFGGDEIETVTIRRVANENRKEFTGDPEQVDAYTRFTFPGRGQQHSDFIWDYRCFTGISADEHIGMVMQEHHDGEWEEMLEEEMGNYDYLMGNDIEFRNPRVCEELKNWGRWYVETTGVDGFRLDALKHISPRFFPEWLAYLSDHFNKRFFCIGEYWQNNVQPLLKYAEVTNGAIQLFDVPLHHNFHIASHMKQDYDMRWLFDNTLVKERPDIAITFVDNHDTQPLQALESTVDYWFKPLANAIILLRQEGIPCIFYPSVYEAKYFDEKNGDQIYIELNAVPGLEQMMKIRASLAYGKQQDYFDDAHTVGWTRWGNKELNHSGCAVLLSNGPAAEKKMNMGAGNAGRQWKNIFDDTAPGVMLDEKGDGVFRVNENSLSVYIDSTVLEQVF
jgi:alpha-amylase